jgi:cytoskeletal protein CcmA (bactofilin family)
MKKTMLMACLVILFLPLAVSAYSLKSGDSVYLAKDETVEGNLYAAGANLTIEGKVTGDVICAGQSINITGEVDGDVICAGQSINITGKIGGNLRVAGNAINFSGQVARNGIIIGATAVTAAGSNIGWDLLILGNSYVLGGDIGRDLYGSAGLVNLTGQVGKNLNLNFGGKNNYEKPLTIASTAKVGGEVKYKSEKNAEIATGASLGGQVIHNYPAVNAKKTNNFNFSWLGTLISIFSSLVIGLVLISFWREPILKITDLMLARVNASLGWGLLALLLTPIIVIILLITIIGIPLSLILLVLWLVAMYLSKILVGIVVGRSLLNNFWLKQRDSLILAMIIGIVVSYLIFSLPFIGWIISLLAMLWGLGGIMLMLKK